MNPTGSTDKTALGLDHPFGLLGRMGRGVDIHIMTRNPNSARKGNAPGLTLVELLIVLVIITVLVAIGFPLVKNIRASAKHTQCVKNLKDWSIVISNYAADHNGRVEWRNWASIGGNTPSVYLDYCAGSLMGASKGEDDSIREVLLEMRHCPSVPQTGSGNPAPTYAFIRPSNSNGLIPNESDYPLAKINNPSRFMIMVETLPHTGSPITGSEGFTSRVKPLIEKGEDLRHKHRVNALLGDLSVNVMTWSDIQVGLDYWTSFEGPATPTRRR